MLVKRIGLWLGLLALAVIGCTHEPTFRRTHPLPPIPGAPSCDYFVDGPVLKPGTPVHVRAPDRLRSPMAVDPSGRWFAVSRDDGASVFSLAWGREHYVVSDSDRDHWAWVASGQLAYRQDERIMVVDLDRASLSELDTEPIPEHAKMNAAAGIVAWLSPHACPEGPRWPRCAFELAWGPLAGTIQRAAIGEHAWRKPAIEWVGRDGRVLVVEPLTPDEDSSFLVGPHETGLRELWSNETVVDENWMMHTSDGWIDGLSSGASVAKGIGDSRLHFDLDAGLDFRAFQYSHVGKRTAYNPRFLTVDPDGKQLVWTDRDNRVYVSDLSTGKLIDESPGFSRITGAVIPDLDCGVVVVDKSRQLTFMASGDLREDVVRGRWKTSLYMLGGSVAGSLDLVVADQPTHWSSKGWTPGPEDGDELRDAWLVGPWLVEPRDAGPRLRERDTGMLHDLPWPDIGTETFLRNAIAVSPDGRWAAVSRWIDVGTGYRIGEAKQQGRVDLYDLHALDEPLPAWSRKLDPEVTAVALTDDQLWIVERPEGHATITAYDRSSGEVHKRWSPGDLPTAIVALAVDPGSDTVYALLPGQRAVWRWSLSGEPREAFPLASEGAPIADYGHCPCDLASRWLRLSPDGQLLIVEAEGGSELLRARDGASLVQADQLTFAAEPGVVLARDDERISAWASQGVELEWQAQFYANDSWVWWDPNGLRDHSHGARDMIAPALFAP